MPAGAQSPSLVYHSTPMFTYRDYRFFELEGYLVRSEVRKKLEARILLTVD